MKKILKSLLALAFFTTIIPACQQHADVNSILENEETRNKMYDAIVANTEYSQEMMAKMMEDDHTQMMMKGNGDMMSMMMAMIKDNPEMMQGMMSNMMNMAEPDSSMCAHMMTMMKDKPNMMGQMMEMMHIEGMMDKETMMRNKENMGKEKHSDDD